MSSLVDIQEPGDIVWTMNHGVLRAWKVEPDGTLVEVNPATALLR